MTVDESRSNGMEPSRYLDYLPAVFRQDEFMGRFLLIFESILAPLERVVDELPLYTDPAVCPAEMLGYLARWVALEPDERLPEARLRRLIASAAEVHRWRGTRRGLKVYLQALTGVEPLITENTDGTRLGRDCRLGLNTRLGRPVPHCVAVTLPVDGQEPPDRAEVEALLEAEKPAHAVYLLNIVLCQRPIDGVVMSGGAVAMLSRTEAAPAAGTGDPSLRSG